MAETRAIHVEKTSNLITSHAFADTLLDLEVNFQVIKLEGSIFVWIGKDSKFGSLAMALATKFVSTKRKIQRK